MGRSTVLTLLTTVSAVIQINDETACTADPVKHKILSWYDEWLDGHQVDYIAPNQLRDSYDFIVVGAGIGGSIVAHRVAMDPSRPSVLLLEAGPPHDVSGLSPEVVPVLVAQNQLSDIDWQYLSEPSEDHCCSWHNDQRQAMPRGKVAGGSGVLNYMMWVRGHREDWDSLMDIEGWSYDEVLPYFKRSESVRHNDNDHRDANRGYDGPIVVNEARNLLEKSSEFGRSAIDAFVESGFKFLEHGQNGGSNVGVGYTEYNVDDSGHRNNAFLGYHKWMKENEENVNLDILPNSLVTKITFAESDLVTANGVEILNLETKEKFTVDLSDASKGEVILGGGSINNPQLLMLSGLGPKSELEKHGIPIVKDIPGIGQNLMDHVMVPVRYHFKAPFDNTEALTANKVIGALTDFDEFKDYLFEGKSALSTSGADLTGFLRSNISTEKYGDEDSFPDLQFYLMRGFPHAEQFFNYKKGVYVDHQCGHAEIWDDMDNAAVIVTLVGLQHPESRGWVRLQSANPLDHPLIQPNYLKEQHDVDVLMEGHKIMSKVMGQPSMRRMWDYRMDCKAYGDMENEANLERYIRDSIVNIYHPVGTCKMGDLDNDEMAVVDNKLMVRGATNLRVVDASIYPHQTSGNTQAPTFMVGERASDFILQKWNAQ